MSSSPPPFFDVTTYSVFFRHIQRFREGLRSKVDMIEGGKVAFGKCEVIREEEFLKLETLVLEFSNSVSF